MKFTPYDKPNPFPKQGLMGDSQNCFAFWEDPPPIWPLPIVKNKANIIMNLKLHI
jgi:hypothetical protein